MIPLSQKSRIDLLGTLSRSGSFTFTLPDDVRVISSVTGRTRKNLKDKSGFFKKPPPHSVTFYHNDGKNPDDGIQAMAKACGVPWGNPQEGERQHTVSMHCDKDDIANKAHTHLSTKTQGDLGVLIDHAVDNGCLQGETSRYTLANGQPATSGDCLKFLFSIRKVGATGDAVPQ